MAQSIALLGMIGVTWRVWFPDVSDDPQEGLPYPAVPLLNALTGVDLRVDWIVSALTLLLLTCLLISLTKDSLERFTGWACAGACLGLLVLVTLNQHRFVPWTYQSLLLFVSYLVLPRETWLRAARWLVVSIYLFSAVSKFDYQFVMTTGRLMFVTGAEMIGLDTSDWSEGSLRLAVLALPLLEFCI